MHARAIAQVDAERRGIHLLWEGPSTWMWSIDGWSIQRRPAHRRKNETVCAEMGAAQIDQLRAARELPSALGPVTLRAGKMPGSLTSQPTPQLTTPADVFTFELDAPAAHIRVRVIAAEAFAYAVRAGKPCPSGRRA